MMKLMVVGYLAMIGFLTMIVCGCDEPLQARYDAMTGEKLSEKIDHLKDLKFEQKEIIVNDWLLRVYRIEIEGHVYYTRACGESSFTHSAACPCHTNSLSYKTN